MCLLSFIFFIPRLSFLPALSSTQRKAKRRCTRFGFKLDFSIHPFHVSSTFSYYLKYLCPVFEMKSFFTRRPLSHTQCEEKERKENLSRDEKQNFITRKSNSENKKGADDCVTTTKLSRSSTSPTRSQREEKVKKGNLCCSLKMCFFALLLYAKGEKEEGL